MAARTENERNLFKAFSRSIRMYRFIDFIKYFIVGRPNECWEWQGGISKDGYGRFGWYEKGIGAAHIASYEFFKGKRNGLCVCHSCDNPPCVNPNHLWLGTQPDNNADMVKKGRNSDNTGEKNPNAKLSYHDVKKIKKLYKTKSFSQKELAKKYHVAEVTIWRIVTNINWKEQ
jgi:DNA-binding XRE family transcriptional regulator